MRKTFSFLKEARAELAKVVWPTRAKTARLTVIVVIITAIFGAFIAAVDFGLAKGIKYVIDVASNKKMQQPPATQTAPGGQPAPVGPAGDGQSAPNQPPQP